MTHRSTITHALPAGAGAEHPTEGRAKALCSLSVRADQVVASLNATCKRCQRAISRSVRLQNDEAALLADLSVQRMRDGWMPLCDPEQRAAASRLLKHGTIQRKADPLGGVMARLLQ